jgi:dUTPase
MPAEIIEKLKSILQQNQSTFAKTKLDVGKFKGFIVKLQIDSEIPRQQQRPMSDEKAQYCDKTFKVFEDLNLVEVCHTPKTVSNLHLVPKYEGLRDLTKASTFIAQQKGIKNSQFRIVQDLRKINSATKNIKRTIPKLPEKIFQQLRGKIVSSIDANQAYWHLVLHPESRPFTCFYLHNRILQFNRVVQGLTSAPACWDEAMEIIFSEQTMTEIKEKLPKNEADLLPKNFSTFFTYYQDDSWTFSDTPEEHLLHLQAVLMAYRIHDIKISATKSTFFPKQFKILGVSFSPQETELALDQLKAQSILDWEKPDSLFTLQSRLYALNYWSKFIPSLAELKFPLNQILRSGLFTWPEEADLAWTRIKSLVALDIRLTIPYQNEKLLLSTDASKVACSCILWVLREEKLKVVGCYSKLFSHTDSLKNIHYKETYALVLGLDHFRPYLLNTSQPISIFTDARALIWVGRNREYSIACNGLMNKLAKIQMEIPYNIYSVPSEVNYLADIFSRSFNTSRFLDKTKFSLSKIQANNIPPLTQPFFVEEDALYQFFSTASEPEFMDKYPRNKNKIMTPKPIKNLYKMFQQCTPEEKYYSALRMLKGWNDQSLQENTTLEQIESHAITLLQDTNSEEYQQFCNKIVMKTMNDLYKDLDPELKKRIKATLEENFKKLTKDKIKQELKNEFLQHETLLNSLIMEKTVLPDSTDFILATDTGIEIKHEQKTTTIHYSLHPTAKFQPRTAYESPGIDLPVQKELILQPNEAKIVDTGVQLFIPANFYAQICPRSSMAKLDLFAYNGVIDNDFSSYIKIILRNNSPQQLKFEPGTLIASALIVPVLHPKLQQENSIKINSDRQEKSFGSSDTILDKPPTQNKSTHDQFNSIILQQTERSCLHELQKIHNPIEIPFIYLNSKIQIPTEINSKQSILTDIIEMEKSYQKLIIQNNALPLSSGLNSTEKVVQNITSTLVQNIIQLNNHESVQLTNNNQKTFKEIQNIKNQLYEEMCTKLAVISIDIVKNQSISRETLAKAQEADDFLSTVRQAVIDKDPNFSKFVIKNSVLYKQIFNNTQRLNKYVLCLPDDLVPSVIHTIHEQLGHPSKTLTKRNFENIYYNRLASKLIQSYVSSCITCTYATKYDIKKVQPNTTRSMQPTKPRQCLYADLIPMYKGQYSYILFCLDAYSQYVYAIPIKDKSSPSVLQGFLSLFSTTGFYETIYLDNETSFQSVAKLLIKIAPTKVIYSTPYCQFQNSSENYIKNFKKSFIKILNNSKNPQENQNWALLLPAVTQSLNRQIIRSLNASRESIHYNTAATYYPFAEITNEDNTEYNKSMEELQENFFQTILKDRIKTMKQRSHNKVPIYEENQLVFMKDMAPGKSTILKLPNRGPYKIKTLSERNVTIIDVNTGKLIHTHIELIRPINLQEFRLILSNRWDISTHHPKSNNPKTEKSIFENPSNQFQKDQVLQIENTDESQELEDEIDLEELFYPSGKPIPPPPPALTKNTPPPPQPPPPPAPDPKGTVAQDTETIHTQHNSPVAAPAQDVEDVVHNMSVDTVQQMQPENNIP